MPGKYDALAAHLSALPAEQLVTEMTFEQVDRLVGGLPPTARRLRQWWANNSQVQALAWRGAGWHVEQVNFAGRGVWFVRGRVGGTRADRLAQAAAASQPEATAPDLSARPEPSDETTVSATGPATVGSNVWTSVEVSVRFTWQSLGAVSLDGSGKVAFPQPLPAQPGLYRLRFTGGDGERLYIGETDNVRRRLGSNYRNPGPRQRTSMRVNEALRTHLSSGGEVSVDAALTAEWSNADGRREALDLARKASRLLAENAALVLAQRAGLRLENIG